jgi:hypothetical protein
MHGDRLTLGVISLSALYFLVILTRVTTLEIEDHEGTGHHPTGLGHMAHPAAKPGGQAEG